MWARRSRDATVRDPSARGSPPVPEDAHLREALERGAGLGVLGHLALQRLHDRLQLLAFRIGVARPVPAEGEDHNWEHAVLVPVAKLHDDLIHADKRLGRQVLPPGQHASGVAERNEP
eukprot:3632946-Prymnesium_polylepis.1